jgi:raffinose/stachyose/melibiose transport system permease protein
MKKRILGILKTLLGVLIICVHILPFYVVVSVAFKSPQDLSSRWVMPFYFFGSNKTEEGVAAEDMSAEEIISGETAPESPVAESMPQETAQDGTDDIDAADAAAGDDLFMFGAAEEDETFMFGAPEGDEYFDDYAGDVEEDLDWLLETVEEVEAQFEGEAEKAEELPQIYLDNFGEAWVTGDLGRALLNNTIITSFTVFLVIVIGSCAAYPLSRHRTRVNNFMYNFFVSCLIVPALTILVPLYKLMVEFGGINTHWGMILTLVTFQLPLSIFLFSGFIGSIPRELDEAALVDGCNRFSIFMRIIFPVLKPVTATVAILVSVNAWNDYQFSIFFLQTPAMYTISVALAQFTSQFISNVGMVAAGCIISAIPATIVFLSLQKYFIKGLTAGAVKG